MAPVVIPSLIQLLTGSVLIYVLYYIHWELTVGSSRRALIKQYGCKPLKKNAELNSFPNNFFGTKAVRQNLTAVKEHRMLELSRGRFNRNGRTIRLKIFLTDMIQTIEPDNLKTMMSLKFKEWSLPDRRKATFVPLLGHGIFTTDGAAWQHSRELLRPNFVRSQVGDLDTFEKHVAIMIKAIPHDGSTVDLQTLFFQLTMDSASEFLFGESTNCLAPGSDSHAAAPRFAEAFNRSQEVVADHFRSGWVAHWLKRKQFAGDIDVVHKYVDRFVQQGLQYRKTLDLDKVDAKAEGRYVFLHELVKRTGDPVQIRSELLNILLAGRDTTASLLSDVFFVLARRPDIWAKLRAEVDPLQGEKPTFQQIKDMKYLRAILNECTYLCSPPPSPRIRHLKRSMLMFSNRSPSLPHRPGQFAHGRRRHGASPGWRPGWQIPTLHSRQTNRPMVVIFDAAPFRLLRR